MKPEHHTLTIGAAADLLKFWKANNEDDINQALGINLNDQITLIDRWNTNKEMEYWIAQPDELKDVVIDGWVESMIITNISHPTAFQHFAYCSPSDKSLKRGKSEDQKIKKYDGYCWASDTSFKHLTQIDTKNIISQMINRLIVIPNLKLSKVKYNLHWYVFVDEFFADSPGYKQIIGDEDWDEQVYPSAIKMAEFYGNGAKTFKNKDKSASQQAIQSVCFATHLLQDLGVYYHVVCDVSVAHADFEADILESWENFYASKNNSARQDFLRNHISGKVKELLKDEFENVQDFESLGKKLVDIAHGRFSANNSAPAADKDETIKVTAQAIACVIKAIDLFSS